MTTDKSVNIDARADINVAASGKVTLAGEGGVVLQRGSSVVNVDESVDISSEHTKVQ